MSSNTHELNKIIDCLKKLGMYVEPAIIRTRPVKTDYKIKIASTCLRTDNDLNVFMSLSQYEPGEYRCMIFPELDESRRSQDESTPHSGKTYILKVNNTPSNIIIDGVNADVVFDEGMIASHSRFPAIKLQYVDCEKLTNVATEVLRQVTAAEHELNITNIRTADDTLSSILSEDRHETTR